MKKYFLILGLVGCAAMNDALTPSLRIEKDEFDGSTIIYQPPVSAASGSSEGWHHLGFEWSTKWRYNAFITVGVSGIHNISSVEFKVDGNVIDNIKVASEITDYGEHISTRRFATSWTNFLKLANAKTVIMKVNRINEYSVSTFGIGSSAPVVSKFSPFVNEVNEMQKKMTVKK
ncbi:MAG: hypothetical protein HYV29_01620 [Ignavibacteriales bacterium]|nr:hypothetical protein [Ignavibacteriales bacterium]